MPTTETHATPSPGSDVPTSRAEDIVLRLAEQVGARVAASTVFGAPVERDGITVIPVARARFGFGGGGGESPANEEGGAGAGAGGFVSPRGYIELKDGRSRFVPAVNPAEMLALMVGAALAALAIMRPRMLAPSAGRRARRRA